jgi:hypothetical protein
MEKALNRHPFDVDYFIHRSVKVLLQDQMDPRVDLKTIMK